MLQSSSEFELGDVYPGTGGRSGYEPMMWDVNREKNRKNLTSLRSKTCFQQVGRVSVQKLENVKALGFCVDSTFAISRTEITPL